MTLCECLPSMSFAYISTIKLMAFVARWVTFEALIAFCNPELSETHRGMKRMWQQYLVSDVLPATVEFAYISTIRMCAWHGSGHT